MPSRDHGGPLGRSAYGAEGDTVPRKIRGRCTLERPLATSFICEIIGSQRRSADRVARLARRHSKLATQVAAHVRLAIAGWLAAQVRLATRLG